MFMLMHNLKLKPVLVLITKLPDIGTQINVNIRLRWLLLMSSVAGGLRLERDKKQELNYFEKITTAFVVKM